MATPVLVHGNRFVMIGDGADPQRLYESSDGARWQARDTDAAWGARYKSADASFAGALWRAGGFETRGERPIYFNDVWRSTDGTRWHRVIATAPWSPKAGAHLVAFRDSLWLIGGEPNDGNVWSTQDGVTWTPHRRTGLPAASPQAVVAFNGALWILGHGRWEGATNDVWTSPDGAHWRQVLPAAPWVARTDPGVEVARGRIWVIAGAGHGVWVFGGKTGGAGGTGFWDGIYVLR
jgi:hypothetical protein